MSAVLKVFWKKIHLKFHKSTRNILKSNAHLLKIRLEEFLFSKIVKSFTKTWNSAQIFFQVFRMILRKSIFQIRYEWLLDKRVGFITKSL